MDCNHARMLLIVCRDAADLDGDESAALNSHLAQCGACLTWSAGERRWEKSVARAMRTVPVPGDLKGRLLTRLDRSGTGRPLGRHWPVWVGAAAALLLTVGLSWFVWFRAPMQIDLAMAEQEVVAQVGSTPKDVEDWFRDRYGVTMTAPAQMNYDLLESFDMAMFHGRRVPKLTFISAGRVAEVYVLPERLFDLHPDAPQRFSGSSRSVQMLEPAPGFRYLIVYNGDSLEPFLRFRNAA